MTLKETIDFVLFSKQNEEVEKIAKEIRRHLYGSGRHIDKALGTVYPDIANDRRANGVDRRARATDR